MLIVVVVQSGHSAYDDIFQMFCNEVSDSVILRQSQYFINMPFPFKSLEIVAFQLVSFRLRTCLFCPTHTK